MVKTLYSILHRSLDLTGLSKSTLQNKIVCKPEIVEVTRRMGFRVIYLYPEVLDAYQKVINRIGI